MHTWGISGPQFLLSYVALFGVALSLAMLARRRVLAAPPGRPGQALPVLDPYEIAYLNGGDALVATTAAANLLRGGVVARTEPDRRGVRLVVVAAASPAAHPVERAVHDLIAAGASRTFGDVQLRVGRTAAVAAIGERLRRLGLVPTSEQEAGLHAAALWFVPLLLLGTARVAAGMANQRPVAFLVVLVGATVVVAAGLAWHVPRATRLGRHTLEVLRVGTPRPEAATVGSGGLAPAQLGLAVALFGAGVLWTADADTAAALRAPRETGGSSSHAGGCGGDGGGDGGGGCGGGCGGCGG